MTWLMTCSQVLKVNLLKVNVEITYLAIVDDKYQASEEYNLVNYFKINYETLIDFDVSELL